MAIIDMQMNINASMGWDGATLSQKPVVVYDGNSNPKYYEFIVLNQKSDAMGTITATTQKESDATVAYVLPYVRSYDFITTKSNSGYRMIRYAYPNNIVIGIPTKSGDDPAGMIDPNTQQSVTEVVTEDAQGAIDVLKNMTAQKLEEAMIDNVDQAIADIQTKDKVVKENAQEYWSIVDTLKAELDTMSDEYIVNALNTNKGSWTTYDQYIIPAYNNSALQRTFWWGWCGPSAMAWIYRGLYNSYKGTYLPLIGENNFENSNGRVRTGYTYSYDPNGNYTISNKGYYNYSNSLDKNWIQNRSQIIDGRLYADIVAMNNAIYENGGGTVAKDMRFSLIYILKNQYTLSGYKTGMGRFTDFFTGLSTADHNQIRNARLPILCGVPSHWIVAFGSKYEYWNWDIVIKIFRWKITLASGRSITDGWILIQDNGYTSIQNNYAPYWKRDNMWHFSILGRYYVQKI